MTQLYKEVKNSFMKYEIKIKKLKENEQNENIKEEYN